MKTIIKKKIYNGMCECLICGNNFYKIASRINAKYCSNNCRYKAQSLNRKGKPTPQLESHRIRGYVEGLNGIKSCKIIFRRCVYCSSWFSFRPRKARNIDRKVCCSRQCYNDAGIQGFQKGNTVGVGEKNGNFKGWVTKEYQRTRTSKKYKQWRLAVFERDSYTCVLCGHISNGDIEADHIKPFSLFSELRFDINNGRTLCKPCHKDTPTYASKLYQYAKSL